MNKFNLELFLKNIKRKNALKNFCLYILGLLIGAISYNIFFSKYGVVSTGSSGLSLLIAKYFNLNESLIIFVVCLICLIIGLISFGYEYAYKMLSVTFIYPIFISLTTPLIKIVDLEDTSLFLIMIMGGGLLGLSSGLIRKSNYSPGGFCVISDILYKYLHIGIGTSTLLINFIIIFISSFLFGFDAALYSLIALVASSYIVDKVLIGISNNKVFYIITKKPYQVRDYIIDNLHYSVTILNGKGGYTNKKKKVLMCVIPTIEYIKVKEVIKKIDKNSFFLIVDTYESSVKKNCKNM